ncbi:MAG: methyltransferase domain-containing protein, partial [Erythrobacter sp.]|uniref:class I SAM-dependent methyltransferase n=1 Tax=Erythrobacter sp. TaxID=1042 RepID=UPI003298F913
AKHDILVVGDHDDRARQEFAMSLKRFTQDKLLPGLQPVFGGRALLKFKKEHGVEPVDRHQIRKAMVGDTYFQTYAMTNRVAQELLWSSVQQPLERNLDSINETAATLSATNKAPLESSSEFDVPCYVSAIDIHCMPGGYCSAESDADVAAGALYDRGVYLYSMGMMGPDNDDMGRSVCNFISRNLDGFSPTAILDMGCTVGHSTLPYKECFSQAQVTGIDVSAPCVRYAHARTAAKGLEVGFLQRDATKTNFADGSFDLIVSHILLHETSGKAMPDVFKECYRLLKPGGYMIHADLPPFHKMGPFMQFILDNETHYNNEPFWGAMRELDQEQMAVDAGFTKANVRFDNAPMAIVEQFAPDSPPEPDEQEFAAGEFAPGGGWEVLIARKDPA